MELIYNKDSIGSRIYLNDIRICGNRPLGDSAIIDTFKVGRNNLLPDVFKAAASLWDGITDTVSQSDIDRIEKLYGKELDILLNR